MKRLKTWKNRWQKADWEVTDFTAFKDSTELQKKYDATGGDKSRMLINQMSGKLDSWAIRWDYTHYKNNAHGVFPTKSLINNTGLDQSGTHTKNLLEYTNLLSNFKPNIAADIKPDKKIINEYLKLYSKGGYIFKLKKILSAFWKK